MKLLIVLIGLICSLICSRSEDNLKLAEMMAFIDEIQNPTNCTGLEFVISDMGTGGGFAAHASLVPSAPARGAGDAAWPPPGRRAPLRGAAGAIQSVCRGAGFRRERRPPGAVL